MKAKLIRELVWYLPETAPYFGKPPGVKTSRAERLALCLNDPKFGWNFVQSFHRSGVNFPPTVADSLQRAYSYVAHYQNDDQMAEAIGLTHPASTTQRNVLKALLCCRGLKLCQIAECMKFHIEVVELFDQLFFNVRDRGTEWGYVSSILYPAGRGPACHEDDEAIEEPGLRLMRAGWEGGVNAVFALAGLNHNQGPKPSVAAMSTELETLIMQNALTEARLGGLNRKNSPGIRHAKDLILASKKVAAQIQDPDQVMGLSAISAGHAVMDTMKAMFAPDINARLEMQRADADLAEKKKDTAKKETAEAVQD